MEIIYEGWTLIRSAVISRSNITLFDEYAVVNTHSIIRAQTKQIYFTVEQLIYKAKVFFASQVRIKQ